jgi:hypothetical protein
MIDDSWSTILLTTLTPPLNCYLSSIISSSLRDLFTYRKLSGNLTIGLLALSSFKFYRFSFRLNLFLSLSTREDSEELAAGSELGLNKSTTLVPSLCTKSSS